MRWGSIKILCVSVCLFVCLYSLSHASCNKLSELKFLFMVKICFRYATKYSNKTCAVSSFFHSLSCLHFRSNAYFKIAVTKTEQKSRKIKKSFFRFKSYMSCDILSIIQSRASFFLLLFFSVDVKTNGKINGFANEVRKKT